MGFFDFFKQDKQGKKTVNPYMDNVIVAFNGEHPWTARDSFEGTQIFGAIGSGKTSGSGRALAHGFLKSGFGGLVLTAKTDEKDLWVKYCRESGRSDSLIVFSPENEHRFNFLDYELKRPGRGAGLTENLVKLFTTVLGSSGEGKGIGGEDPFWRQSLEQLLRNAISLISISGEVLSVENINKVISSAPYSLEELQNEDWQENSFCADLLYKAASKDKNESEEQDFVLTGDYWTDSFPRLAEKTRSTIVLSFTSMADIFLRRPLRDLFGTTTNIVPELTHEGMILLIDLPVHEFNEVGRYAQNLMKYIWQRAAERRDTVRHPRPVFLWVDEAQYFLMEGDQKFQSTARSKRVSTVLLSQNISNYYVALGGGQKGREKADSLLGLLNTKIFHSNNDFVTNKWGSDHIGQSYHGKTTTNTNRGDRRGASAGASFSEELRYDIEPARFARLKKGGPQNNLIVEAIVTQGGADWGQGASCILARFKQG